jgi:ankyrin repeat protein
VDVLLRAGADAGSRSGEGRTPLLAACLGGHGEAAELLLLAGADPNTETHVRPPHQAVTRLATSHPRTTVRSPRKPNHGLSLTSD